ncbi:MAG: hypothetical protein KUG78_22005 [Kangiellaceae bacterium]|nr:hypothetical protein [Kangiellaceae bacterium]
MNKALTICLILVGIINFIPVAGVLSSLNLENAYAIELINNDLIILMRHRALLFGVLGGYVLYSAFAKEHQVTSMVMVGASMVGFIALALLVEGYNDAIYKIILADVAGIAILVLAVILKLIDRKKTA